MFKYPKLLEAKRQFEQFLFGDEIDIITNDEEFFVDRIVMLPKIRPHKLEKAVRLAIDYCQIETFRRRILEKSNECPVLIYKLYKRGVFAYEEIKPFSLGENAFILFYYFHKEIDNFEGFIKSKDIPFRIEKSFLDSPNDIDQLIEYGFLPSSIEFYLKYDSLDDLLNINILKQEAKWSPFEWSYKPKYLDFLSFAVFFGSIKCFKYLLMNEFEINDQVLSMVVCSGNFDIFHINQCQQCSKIDIILSAIRFFHISLLVFLVENGADVNAANEDGITPLHFSALYGHLSIVDYLVNQKANIQAITRNVDSLGINGLLFITLHNMVIFVWLNILLIKKLMQMQKITICWF